MKVLLRAGLRMQSGFFPQLWFKSCPFLFLYEDLGRSQMLSEPQFPLLRNDNTKLCFLRLLWGWIEARYLKCKELCQACNRCSTNHIYFLKITMLFFLSWWWQHFLQKGKYNYAIHSVHETKRMRRGCTKVHILAGSVRFLKAVKKTSLSSLHRLSIQLLV